MKRASPGGYTTTPEEPDPHSDSSDLKMPPGLSSNLIVLIDLSTSLDNHLNTVYPLNYELTFIYRIAKPIFNSQMNRINPY